MGSRSYHIPDIPPTSCSLLMSAYLHLSKKHMARQCITRLTRPQPASPRSSSLAFIHRQSDKHIPKRTSKQPSAQLAYTLSTPMLSYNHFFESWGRNKAMEDMSGTLRSTPPQVLGLEDTAKSPPTPPPVELCNSHPL